MFFRRGADSWSLHEEKLSEEGDDDELYNSFGTRYATPSDSAPKQGRKGEWRLTDSFSSLSFMDIPWGKEVYLPSRWVRTACETKGSP